MDRIRIYTATIEHHCKGDVTSKESDIPLTQNSYN